ncbi:MAG: peptidase C39 [Clostridiales Family XIII bacterium]|jgi:hypothetical protein|nr:peptidase C39 [Clostridiales Family XIII bacterium]
MKNPLAYQRTEYDCGPTTLLNAVSFLFEREEIPPELLKFVSMYAMDSYGRCGEHGKGGTSRLAMMFISGWLNEYGQMTKFPIESEYLSGTGVTAEPGSRLTLALKEGGAVIVRVKYEVDHYLLLTGLDGDRLLAWDPYYRMRKYSGEAADVELVTDKPKLYNCVFSLERLNARGKGFYMLGDPEKREAVTVFNKKTRTKYDFEPEYSI